MKSICNTLLLVSTLIFLASCSKKVEDLKKEPIKKPIKNEKLIKTHNNTLEKLEFKDLDGFFQDDLQTALDVFKKACTKSKRNKKFTQACQKSENAKNAKTFFTSNFTPYKMLNKDLSDQGVITGYYEPLLQGSLVKTDIYKYAIYKTPKDMFIVDFSSEYSELKKYRLRGKIKGNKIVPYDTREQILKKNNLEVIAYVDDKVDLFFLHIQGSGKVQLRDGSFINIAYANQNGRKYKSVGKYMLKNAYIGSNVGVPASMQGMKFWFSRNPSKTDEVLNHNQSFIFFRQSQQGATGSLGVELVAKRNLAVDRKYVDLGTPIFIQTKNPINKKSINKVMIAADTGGAIKGDIRADFFYGFGKEAAKYAGRMKEKGKLILLLPNDYKFKQ